MAEVAAPPSPVEAPAPVPPTVATLFVRVLNSLSTVTCDPRLDQITSVVGNGFTSGSINGGDGGPATAATLNSPYSVWGDASNNIYTSSFDNRIRRVDPTSGIISTFAGTGAYSAFGDGGALTSATFNCPMQLQGNSTFKILVVADFNNNNKFRMLNSVTNTVTTVAGAGSPSSLGDGGKATAATFNNPFGAFMDSSGNVYTSEWGGSRVRKVDAITKIVSAFLGADGVTAASPDGTPATSAGMQNAVQLYVDTTLNILYACSYIHNKIYLVTMSTAKISTAAGGGSSGLLVGPATAVTLSRPFGVWRDRFGNMFISELDGFLLKKVNVAGIVSLVAGNGVSSTTGASTSAAIGDGGPPTSASFSGSRMIWADTLGYVYVADTDNNKVRKIYDYIPTSSPTRVPTTSPSLLPTLSPSVAPSIVPTTSPTSQPTFASPRLDQIISVVGTGVQSAVGASVAGLIGDGGPATAATLNGVYSVFGDSVGTLYVSDIYNYKVRRTNSAGIISTFAGTGATTSLGDGGALTSASIGGPIQFYGNSTSKVFVVADDGGSKIRKLNGVTNIVSTVAGTGSNGASTGDGGPATASVVTDVYGVFIDTSGHVYTSQWSGNRVRKIDATTKLISAYLGADGVTAASTVGTPATSIGMLNSAQLYIDTSVNQLFVASNGHNKVYFVSMLTGVWGIFAGVTSGGLASGPATSVALSGPFGVWKDTFGNTFISEVGQNFVKKVNAAGILSILAGTGAVSAAGAATSAAIGDGGPPLSATFSSPRMMWTDTFGYFIPTAMPTQSPTLFPSAFPTKLPSVVPTLHPTVSPSSSPTIPPTALPTFTSPRLDQITSIVGSGVQSSGAGASVAGLIGDGGQASAAILNNPYAVWSDTSGVIYLSDSLNNKVRRVDSYGIINTFLGTGAASTVGEGVALTAASIYGPVQFCGNSSTSKVFVVVDNTGCKIRQASYVSNVVWTIAGLGSGSTSTGDGGPATSATLNSPFGVIIDNIGNIYTAELYGNRVRKIDAFTKIISAYLGATGLITASPDGTKATSAGISQSTQLYFDLVTNQLFIVAYGLNKILTVVVSSDTMTNFAGLASGSQTGPATSVSLSGPFGVWKDTFGNSFIAETGRHDVKKVNTVGIVSLLSGIGTASNAGSGAIIGDSGPPTSATFNTPRMIFVDTLGYIFVADMNNNRIRKIYDNIPTVSPTAFPTMQPTFASPRLDQITSVVGTGVQSAVGASVASLIGDGGPATAATLYNPYAVWGDTSGLFYVSDYENNKVRQVSTSGIITTFIGNGGANSLGNGGALTSAGINHPIQMYGNSSSKMVFVIDAFGCLLREINTINNIINVVVGSSAGTTSLGDGGPATSATFYIPIGVFADSVGNIYASEFRGNCVRKIDSTTKNISAYFGAVGATAVSQICFS